MGKLQYRKVTRTLGYKEEKPEVFKIAQISYPQISFDTLVKEVAHAENVNETQTMSVIIGLMNRCSMYLGMGHGVSLGALGSFKPVVRSIVTQTEEDANANTITNKVVRFYPGKALKDAVKGLVMEELDKKRD